MTSPEVAHLRKRLIRKANEGELIVITGEQLMLAFYIDRTDREMWQAYEDFTRWCRRHNLAYDHEPHVNYFFLIRNEGAFGNIRFDRKQVSGRVIREWLAPGQVPFYREAVGN